MMRGLLSRIPRTPLVLGCIAVVTYLPGFWWGAPHASAPDRTHSWGVDDEPPLGPLAEMHNIAVPKGDRNLGYPLMHSFLLSAAYTPYLGYLWWAGAMTSVSPAYPFGLTDPVRALKGLTLIAHLLSVLMGVGVVLAAYDAGRVLWDRRTGILASLFVMVSFPMFYYARTGNVDVPVLFFTALALAAFARVLVAGFTMRRAAWLGAFVGTAVATKETSFASFLALPFVVLAVHRRNCPPADGRWSWAFWRTPLAALLTALVAFAVGSGLAVDPERYRAHVAFATARVADLAAGKVPFLRSFPTTWDGNSELALLIGRHLTETMTFPGLILAVVGMLWVLHNDPRRASFALPALTYVLVLFWSARAAQLRYLLPVGFTLAFFEARVVALAWESGWAAVRYSFLAVALWAFSLNLLRGVDLTHAMINDSRYAAGAWLATRAQPGDRVEYFGLTENLPPLAAGVVTTRTIVNYAPLQRPRIDESAVAESIDAWRRRSPEFIIMVPDLFSPPGVPHSGACPPRVYQLLQDGSLGYELAKVFQTPSLILWVRRPALGYSAVNPLVSIFVRRDASNAREHGGVIPLPRPVGRSLSYGGFPLDRAN